jgi:hypothetical protein
MSHSRIRELRDQAIEAVTELYQLHGDVEHEILSKVLGEIIVETEYSMVALKDTAEAGEEVEPEVVDAKPASRARGAKKSAAPKERTRKGVRRGVKRKPKD